MIDVETKEEQSPYFHCVLCAMTVPTHENTLTALLIYEGGERAVVNLNIINWNAD